jgi:hypothetical protein
MTSEELAARIKAILDPPAREEDLDGKLVKIGDDAYYNVEGVIQDIRHGQADAAGIRTLKRVQKQICDVIELCRLQAGS